MPAYDTRWQLEWLESCRRRSLRIYGQAVTTDAGFTFTFEDWNLFDDSAVWCEAAFTGVACCAKGRLRI
jgi:hypothetical protein